MKFLFRGLTMALLLLTCAADAQAQGAAVINVEQACQPMARRLCGARSDSLDRVLACVNKNPRRFQANCRAAINNQRAADADRRQLVNQPAQPGAPICQNDLGVVCGPMRVDTPRARACLRAHRAQLSAQCGAWLDGQP